MSIRWTDADWRREAACLGQDPAPWFPTTPTPEEEIEAFAGRGIHVEPTLGERNAVEAIRTCIGWADRRKFTDIHTGEVEWVAIEKFEGCPVALECATWAVLSRQQAGVFGGFGADGKLKWLRAMLWGDDSDEVEDPDPLGTLMAEAPEPIPETVDLDELKKTIAAEQTQLKIAHGLVDKEDTQRPWAPKRACDRCGGEIPAGSHPPDRNTPGATCGKAVTYAKGCRCFPCRVANAFRER